MKINNKILVKIRSSLDDRILTEQWLKEMVLRGWILSDYKYIIFTFFTKYIFRKENSCECSFKIIDVPKGYEKSAIADEEEDGWNLIQQRQNSAILIDRKNGNRNSWSDEETELALKKLQYERLYSGIAKVIYIIAILLIFKEPIRAWRVFYLFIASTLLFPFILRNFVYRKSKESNFKISSIIITSCNLGMFFTIVFETFYAVAKFMKL